jgi:Tol biopolymer transport system component
VGRADPATGTRDIWVLDVARGTSSRFTFDKADDLNPVWSPDGTRLAFTSNRKGRRDLYWRAAGGIGGDELLLEGEGQKSLEAWSPDGKTLLFNVDSREIFAVPVAAERRPVPVLQGQFPHVQGQWSPDGRWIAYASNESGRQEIFVQSYPPTGGKFQISTTGGAEPVWRRDGNELFFLSGTKLAAVEINATGSSFDAGVARDLFDVPTIVGSVRRNRFVATGDGQRFLVVTAPHGLDRTPFWVVLNWPAALQR